LLPRKQKKLTLPKIGISCITFYQLEWSDIENIRDIAFDEATGNPTITFIDGTVKNYAVAPANAPQTVALAPGQTVVVTVEAAQ
jgi:hypothetical protein